jgi:histidinol-phosphate aminotransferase
MTAPLAFRPATSSVMAYEPDWLEIDRSQFLCLDRNESTRPLPDFVREMIVTYLDSVGAHRYPNSDSGARAVARYCAVEVGAALPTNGSDQAIDLCLRGFLARGDKVMFASPEFSIFSHVAKLLGAVTVPVPYLPDLSFPYAEFEEKLRDSAPDVILFINPNNPTGTPVDGDFIARVVRGNPTTPVIVDEAYFEFTGNTVAQLLPDASNLIILRTMSKAFAMAGLRYGYVIAHRDVIRELTKLRNPFDVNALAVVAAEANLSNTTAMQEYVRLVMEESKPRLLSFARKVNQLVTPGSANFVLLRPPSVSQTVANLQASGILVRTMTAPALTGMIRVSVGLPEDTERFVDAYARQGNLH